MKRLGFIKAFLILAVAAGTPACSVLVPQKPVAKKDPKYKISISSGNLQNSPAGALSPTSFVAKVIDTNGGSAENVLVDWKVLSGGGSLFGAVFYTSTGGYSYANLTFGSALGPNSVSATVHGTSESVTFDATGVPGPAFFPNCTITGTGPIEPDGINFSTVTITLKDQFNNVIPGVLPTFSATGTNNTYGVCSATDASGISHCSLKSTTAEVKLLSLVTPTVTVGGTVTFAPTAATAANSSITGTGPVIADGVATSTVTITLKDAANIAVPGITPTFSATNTGATNSYTACSATNASGVSTCTMKSTHAETKTLSITSPVAKAGGNVVFNPGAASTLTSTITGTGPIENDGVTNSTITITLKDAQSNPISGTTPTFGSTGTANTIGGCSATNASGISTCTLASTTAETKVLSITGPIAVTGGSVVFQPGAVNAANSTITGSGPVTADNVAQSTITITLKDASNVPVAGITPTFSATDTGATNVYGACSTTNVSGISNCSMKSTHAETKTLSITSPVAKAGGTVVFQPGPISNVTSTITGTSNITANGVATSSVTITLLDAQSNPVSGTTPTFSATDTAVTNVYSACSSSNASGVSTCTLKSTKAEVKTLTLLTPVAVPGGTTTFIAGASATTFSTITGSGPVENDGSSTSAITITLYDAFNNPVSAVTPTFSATNTSATNGYGACSASNASGVSTCTLTSTYAETKTLSIATPIAKSGGTVVFAPGSASTAFSTITGTSNITANGIATSTVTITIKDGSNVPIGGITPTFAATDTGSTNVYSVCSATNLSGVSTCTLSSTKAEVKTLSITSPIAMSGGTTTFIAGAVSSTTSLISGTGPVTANGVATSTVTIVLYDADSNPVSGTTPTFSATDTGATNVYTACSSSNASGTSTCTMKSTHAEAKTLSIATPVVKAGGSVTFNAGAAAAATSTITGTGSVSADGSATSTVTITILDAQSNPISGTTPTFTATNTGATNVYGGCSATNASGVSTCTLSSSAAEVKTLSIATPVAKAGGTVTFTQAAKASNCNITGTGPNAADGATSSTVSVTIKDYNNVAISGVTPTFSATDTGGTNVYGACGATNGSGVASCTLQSSKAEVKTLSITSPVATAGGTVTFTQVAKVSNSSISGTGPVSANGVAASTVTIVLKDYSNTAIVGTTPTFSATDTGGTNVQTACSATDGTGTSTCTLKSTHAETKTLSVATPIAFSGGTVSFTAGAANSGTSSISGSGPVTADGSSVSTITITLKDASNNAISGTTPTFSATDTGGTNSYGACSSSNASGVSTCTLTSTVAETKTLSLVTPVAFSSGTVVFTPDAASAANSSIVGTGSVGANGTSISTITITLRDANNNPISGTTPSFTATDTGSTNAYSACSNSNGSGVSTCTLSSTVAETKTLSIASPVSKAGGTVVFTQVAKASNSSIVGTGPVLADGVSTSTITITIKDYANAAIVGITPTFSATDTGSTNSYGACSATDASGISSCSMTSTQIETKTLSVTAPISFSGGTVDFQ